MKKSLRSGNVYMGTCGDPTDLYDSNGNNLKVGDLVAIWTQDVEERGWNDKPTFVVQEKIGPPYIMGLKGAHLVRKHIRNGESSDAGHCDTILDSYLYDAAALHNPKEATWYVMRIKSQIRPQSAKLGIAAFIRWMKTQRPLWKMASQLAADMILD